MLLDRKNSLNMDLGGGFATMTLGEEQKPIIFQTPTTPMRKRKASIVMTRPRLQARHADPLQIGIGNQSISMPPMLPSDLDILTASSAQTSFNPYRVIANHRQASVQSSHITPSAILAPRTTHEIVSSSSAAFNAIESLPDLDFEASPAPPLRVLKMRRLTPYDLPRRRPFL
jgi:hypothetical protein